jgi:hypothetical protein
LFTVATFGFEVSKANALCLLTLSFLDCATADALILKVFLGLSVTLVLLTLTALLFPTFPPAVAA